MPGLAGRGWGMKAFGRGLVFFIPAILFILLVLLIPGVFLVASAGFAQTSKSITVQPAPVYKGKRLYSNSWAVVIGVNRYQHPSIPTLRYARKDAEDLRDALPRLGFPKSQILTLFDRQATKRNIERLLGDEMRRRVSPGDRVFVFFSGHGKDEEKEGYLIPYDADPKNLFSTAISMSQLTVIAKRMRAQHVLFAVDACYSGYAIFRTKKLLNPELVTDLTSRPAVQVITAGRAGEVAQEREGNGLFTRVLLKGLQGSADRRGWGWLSLEHLGEYVRDRVYAESGRQQYPQFGNLSGDGQFVFLLPTEKPAFDLVKERARLAEERRKLEVEKAGLERERLAAEKA